jgi:predicted house-cleaning noncanonical NTP pyrophosphatase (MazG superfamily)
MIEIKYDKLVRDCIPTIIQQAGKTSECHSVESAVAVEYLDKKLSEELGEYYQEKSMNELADLLEVIHGIVFHKGMKWEDLESIRQKKRQERGGFEEGIVLEKVFEP